MIIFQTLFGSHLYGTETPESDRDYKAVMLPSASQILLGRVQKNIQQNTKVDISQKNSAGDVDTEIFSLCEFVRLLLENQTVALDVLFAPSSMRVIDPHPVWIKLVNNRHRFASKNVKSFVGYALKQASKYGIKGSRLAAVQAVRESLSSLPRHERLVDCALDSIAQLVATHGQDGLVSIIPGATPMLECCGRKIQYTLKVSEALKIVDKIWEKYGERSRQAMNNEGVDYKALSHAVRCMVEAKEYLDTGEITLPLRRQDRALIMTIKTGQMPYSAIAPIIEDGVEQIETSATKSSLPEKPDYEFADRFIEWAYGEVVRGHLA